ncbi:MAG: Toluene efflux pump periplasmic linker protein TtgA precursor [Candidatus Accumulibacter appositus]|uniref:Toluene efflux pump periplasmic linker protein TtgA n=1 Tax=Candidatus Accumulibacter appositus TaxID=1454003 RepID=A0A011QNX1_9PROT|nr:efflux RND transporter periplasmic adaptor subunit [Accumulibacter sp.]EXI80544.1 MAG: Toluene efflux pump periplasmic linker protein TtgA precursor [Candidatus Accumulibacter appositus]HRF03670.1 efflux RND transporter periplasmic adaptor subunit [Accumulibacter sp.]
MIASTRRVFQRRPRVSAALQMLSCVSLALVVAGCSDGKANGANAAPAVVEVGVVSVVSQPLALQTELAGRTVAALSAEVRPQVTALVRERLFQEGSQVKAGQPLYQLDSSSAEASLRVAKAGVVRAKATLSAAEMKAARQAALLKAEVGTTQDNEDAQAALLQARADLQSAQATQVNAQLELDRTRIVAPIAGRVDTSTVARGALVTANQTDALTTVQQLDPIWVDVAQSSADWLRLRRQLDSGALEKGETKVSLTLEDGSEYEHEGVLQVQGVAVDSSSGAMTLRARVPNPDGLLLPGMFVRVSLNQAIDPEAILVPQAGVTRNARGEASAMVVKEDGAIEKRALTTAAAVDGQWRVTEGLKAGDRLVVEGLGKVKDGQIVYAVPMVIAKANTGFADTAAIATTTH